MPAAGRKPTRGTCTPRTTSVWFLAVPVMCGLCGRSRSLPSRERASSEHHTSEDFLFEGRIVYVHENRAVLQYECYRFTGFVVHQHQPRRRFLSATAVQYVRKRHCGESKRFHGGHVSVRKKLTHPASWGPGPARPTTSYTSPWRDGPNSPH